MGRNLATIVSLLCITAGLATAAVNVRDHGAVGDGKADDTEPFRAAIQASAAAREPVYVPRGVYRVGATLVLENTAMVGPEGGAWPADIDALPALVPTHRDGPCVELRAGGSLRGISIRYEWDKEPQSGPAAVLVSGIGAWISGVKIQYPWDGIMTDGVHNVGRLNIADVFIVSPRNVGVRVTGTWDVPALRNIEVWNAGPVPRPLERGVGFDLGKNDLIRLTDCFAFAMGTGFLLRDRIPGCSIKGGTWGLMTGCATDYCGVGIRVQGEHTLSVAGGTFWEHQQSLIVDGPARIRLAGAELKSNGAPAVEVRNSDHVIITGCSLLRPMREYRAPAVLLTGGRIVLQGNVIQSTDRGVVIGPKVRSYTGSGNMIDSPKAPMTDGRRRPR